MTRFWGSILVRGLLRRAALCAALSGAIATAGCQSTPAPKLVSCPLPTSEQANQIIKFAPLGTPREEVLKHLEEQGIEGSFGENQSIYYCDIWKRGEDIRWHMNVVLLFDADGKLYATRPEATAKTQ